ncbi:MAG: transporter substrate-binding domain-containing protein [Psychrosphaera sp.]|nr:transporter substrate-binding domain-containing protein [Psychrosphaera sp.]
MLLTLITLTARAGPLPEYCPKTLEFLSAGNWYPYTYIENNIHKGINLELMLKVTSIMGCRVRLVNIPSKRAHKSIVTQSTLVLPAATINQARLKYARFSKPYRFEKVSIFYLQSDLLSDDIKLPLLVSKSDLIANNNSAWYGKKIEKLRTSAQSNKFVHVQGMKRQVEMLRRNRVQAIIQDHIVACNYFHQQAQDISPRMRFIVVNKVNVSFMFSKTIHPAFLPLFDKTLVEQIELGFVEQLLARYTPLGC